ncbi:hypothetical protein DEJ36_02925 [Curtobacterium sp. MCPF17_052]|nr:hypothetical protein [Curtobacterium sp. MCPF17_052]WIB12967.1 hypothetical protein DEJ36_02925 [Curtobacterium sp. MCPF17_052]
MCVVDHQEQAVPVPVELRALPALHGVLHREGVDAEFLLHLFEVRRLRVREVHPDEGAVARDEVRDLLDREVPLRRRTVLPATRAHHGAEPSVAALRGGRTTGPPGRARVNVPSAGPPVRW